MLLLFLYRLAALALTPLARPLLAVRAQGGKEDSERIGERLGYAGEPRPAGRLLWLHGASVGESLSLLPLIERLIQQGFVVLVTSGTSTSAEVLRQRLPGGALHQYMPLDAPGFVARFLDHWRPELALFAESEIWPNMLGAMTRRGIPLVLVNARISPQSVERWGKIPSVASRLFGQIALCLAQDDENAERFRALGAPRVEVVGNLKFDVAAPPVDPLRLAALQGTLGARTVFAAVSTHEGEEAMALAAHVEIARVLPDLLTIVAPRHPERGDEIVKLAAERRLVAARRALDEPIAPETEIYVADTMGELGLFFRAASVVFVGRSFLPGGGHNPIEPARFGCAVLHGPKVEDFAEVYAALDAAKGAVCVADAAALGRTALLLLEQPSRVRKMGRAGGEVVAQLTGAANRTLAALAPFLARRDAA
jgi:3-deoxy-D-manno-octulosonic-acid transferase